MARHSGPAGRGKAAVEIVYEGTWRYEGHLKRPHQIVNYASRLTFLDDGMGNARLDWRQSEEGSSDSETETTLLLGRRVLWRGDASRPFTEVRDERREEDRDLAELGLPWRAVGRAMERPDRTRLLGREKRNGRAVTVVSVCDERGNAWTVYLDSGTHRIVAAERLWPHPRLGDVLDSTVYEDYVEREGFPLPGTIHVTRHPRWDTWTLDLRLVSVRTRVEAKDSFAVPADVKAGPETPGWFDSPAAPVVSQVAPGIWAFALEDVDSRSLVVEFADHVAVLEAPVSSAVGERLVSAIAERFSTKPIRYALFGHHHPQYIGGVRALLAAGATVFCPKANAAFVREIAALPFTLRPDALARSSVKPRIAELQTRRLFEDSTNCFEAIDIGSESNHTDEYVIFYFPRIGLLFEGDLGWAKKGDGTVQASPRAAALLGAIRSRGLDVKQLVQSWPVAGNPPTLTLKELQAAVEAARAPSPSPAPAPAGS